MVTGLVLVRLMSGTGDLLSNDTALAAELQARHACFGTAVGNSRFGAVPESALFRVRGTRKEMEPGAR